jgi:hypothetical protein
MFTKMAIFLDAKYQMSKKISNGQKIPNGRKIDQTSIKC